MALPGRASRVRLHLLLLTLAASFSPSAKAWGPWASSSSHPGIQFRFDYAGAKTGGKWLYKFEIKNTYSYGVDLNFTIAERTSGYSNVGRWLMRPGQSIDHADYVAVQPGDQQFTFRVRELTRS